MKTDKKKMIPVVVALCGMAAAQSVPDGEMKRVFEAARTPYKYGIVIPEQDGKKVDCPRVFRVGGKWYMHYVCMNEVGYETHLASSEDLLTWRPMGKVLSFGKGGWDQWQTDGGMALIDTDWQGSYAPQKFQGKYWMSYIGGALKGYETDPLSIGMAWAGDAGRAREWTRVAGNPVLAPNQADARDFEKLTLYKSTIIWDRAKTLGQPYVMYYNAKTKNGYERIGMAISSDMVRWKRYGSDPVVVNGEEHQRGISGDPQIVRMGDLWVMFYFGAGWEAKAFDTFAASYDLVHWTKWSGAHLIDPSESWDATYAHKPWLVNWKGTVYHFYCAVGDKGRTIALATSRNLRGQ
jgi:predicted GH43/DUF377 family glycosyl hydrolase